MIIAGVLLSVAVVVVIGISVARRVGGEGNAFLVAGRGMALPLVAAGLMGQAVDTNATVGNTDLAAAGGWWAGYSLPFGLAVCLVLTGTFLAPRMNRALLFTLPDAFGRRYGRAVEVVASVLMVVAFTVLVAGNLVAGGFLFDTFLGVPFSVGVLLLVLLVMLYTVSGGMLADAYTAAVQMVITLVAALSLLLWLVVGQGVSVPAGQGPFDAAQLTDPAAGAVLNWATLVALGIGDIVAIDFMQRIFTARSGGTARRACYTAAVGAAVVGVPYSLLAVTSPQLLPGGAEGPVLYAVLDQVAPVWLTVLVLSAIVAASMSTANGAVIGSAAVLARNVLGRRGVEDARDVPGSEAADLVDPQRRTDPLVRATRWAMVPVVAAAVALALAVPETGVLLTLAFDLLLASLVVPFLLGVWWSRGTARAAMAAMVAGIVVRLGLFVLTPTFYGAPNDVLHLDNDVVGPGFDGWPTFIAPVVCLAVYLAISLADRGDRGGATIERADGKRREESPA